MRYQSLLSVWNLFCCYSLLSEIAESSQCVELVLLLESLPTLVRRCFKVVCLLDKMETSMWLAETIYGK